MYDKNSFLPLLAIAIVGTALLFKKKNKKCDKNCKNARNYKSQVNSIVADNSTWKELNALFNANESKLLADVVNVIKAKDQSGYASAILPFQQFATVYGVGIIISTAEGLVAFDSVKGLANTHNNYLLGLISENYNTKASTMSALLSCDGKGNEIIFNPVTNQFVAVIARRSHAGALGVMSISKPPTAFVIGGNGGNGGAGGAGGNAGL